MHVLAPEALPGLEREVVAVGVGDGHEPQLGLLQQVADRRIRAIAVDDVVGQPSNHLGRDPLPRVLSRREQGGRALPVGSLLRVLGHLEGDDVLAVDGLADRHQLGDVRVFRGDLLVLGLDAPVSAVATEHVRPVREHRRRSLSRGLTVDELRGEVDALLRELLCLFLAEYHLDIGLVPGGVRDRQVAPVDPAGPQGLELGQVELSLVDVVAVVSGLGEVCLALERRGIRRGHAERAREHDNDHCGPEPRLHWRSSGSSLSARRVRAHVATIRADDRRVNGHRPRTTWRFPRGSTGQPDFWWKADPGAALAG